MSNKLSDSLLSIILGDIKLFLSPLTIAVSYTLGHTDPNQGINIFGIRLPIGYFPLCLFALTLLSNGPIMTLLYLPGYFAGYVYLFLDELWPMQGGRKWLEYPRMLVIRQLGVVESVFRNFVLNYLNRYNPARNMFTNNFNKANTYQSMGSVSNLFSAASSSSASVSSASSASSSSLFSSSSSLLSSSSSSSSSSASFSRRAFQGKGHRLGS